MKYNTLKHLVECIILDDILASIPDEEIKAQAISEVANCFPAPGEVRKPVTPDGKPGGFWFWYDGAKMEEYFDKNGFIKTVHCGDSKIMCLDVPAFVNEWYRQLRYHPEDWMRDIYSSWVRKYDIYDKKGE